MNVPAMPAPSRAPTTVSVVIPTHNRLDKLREALASVLAQTRAPDEVIVVDDGSTDGTADLDFAAISPLIRRVRHAVNRGGSAARNTGVQHARGEWIALLDADDLWLPDKLARQLAGLRGDASDPDVLVSNVLRRQPGRPDRAFNPRPPRAGEDIGHYLMVARCAMQTSGLIVRRSCLLACPFDDGLRKHQDWDLVLRLQALPARFAYRHEALSIYRTDPDPQRISVRESDVRISVDWLHSRQACVPAEAAAYYFAYHCLSRALRVGPGYAWTHWWRLSTRTPASLGYSLAGLAGLLADRARGRSQHLWARLRGLRAETG